MTNSEKINAVREKSRRYGTFADYENEHEKK